MNYKDGLDWIHERIKFGIKPGVRRMKWMLGRLGNPEKNINGIHVVGTNGKGSTVSYMRNALNHNNYEVGTFTSPYIETFNERISVDGQPISDEDIVRLVEIVRPVSEQMEEETDLGTATEFEIITMMMFVYFGRLRSMDFVIIEAGLGAANDSTNVFEPIMTVLTGIGLDHTNILGDTLLDIARDKSGVIKPGTPLVFSVKDDTARDYIYKVLDENHARGIELGRDILLIRDPKESEFQFQYGQYDFQDIRLKMAGRHQEDNAALAIAALLELHDHKKAILDFNKLIRGVEEMTWPGRIEKIQEEPLVILDGAHNNEAVGALVDTLRQYYGNRRITVLFSAIEGKPLKTMVDMLSEIADEFNVTHFDFPKALSMRVLYEAVPHPNKHEVNDFKHFIEEFDGDMLLVTGSLYFISEVKQHMNRQ
ncbi:bifunctional folylpolyglutamate synthase/dihydrofolate synthase [Salinicoccus halodurans]|uniref:tetrahydrofolate synthase n=1 Tax=Salinicoccus halodurans TaxID=407035 RepID=A0A0F7D4G0_9STAP|nr:folylpolyglutamate synthase/dihydrofolate synthase family protein [Salinicoccus halodurans]AKG74170.1 folylpolyglutamate synthase [Salinicoccus halodurans]SFK61438.1 dihydrofolate synthase / folylpolyglutamate synthase [Salinicoccus halodurans]